ncbi:MAG: glycosyltransferase [Chromatiaceae bacterium]|nr:glycosyltransferase [Chromatiaceae bacterium]
MSSEPRILLYSPRKLAPVISRCFSYEFEDAIEGMDSVEMLTPEPVLTPTVFDYVDRAVSKIGRATRAARGINPGVRTADVAGRHQLFFAVCQFATDLTWLNALRGWRARCDIATCWLEEIWAKDLVRLKSQLSLLSEFDYIFTNCRGSVDGLAVATGRPVVYAPPGVDCLSFFPGDPPVERVIDVFNMGRRHPATHKALLDLARERRFFYLYDTFKGNIQVQSPAEHRLQLANLIKRSRYFIANKAKATETGETAGQQEVGFRFFEGAAAGAVMIGDAPDVDSFRENFDWPDAVIHLPYGSSDVTDLIADLDRQPERTARIRRDSLDNSLRRHDWAYRWRQVLETLGLPIPEGLVSREARLRRRASGL